MAIKIVDEYEYVEPATADYPGGAFKNTSAPGAEDGTPFEKAWADDIQGFLQGLLATAGIVPSGAPDTAVTSQYRDAMESLMWAPGDTKWCMYSTPGRRWLEMNGQTVGNAASNATARANADTIGLFTALWSLAALSIFTSAGAASVRGANAAADFAANKQMGLPDMRGEFPRGWDHGRGVDADRMLGSWQDWATGAPKNTEPSSLHGDGTTSGSFYQGPAGSALAAPHPSHVGFVRASKVGENVTLAATDSARAGQGELDLYNAVVGDDETRARNIAGMYVIRY